MRKLRSALITAGEECTPGTLTMVVISSPLRYFVACLRGSRECMATSQRPPGDRCAVCVDESLTAVWPPRLLPSEMRRILISEPSCKHRRGTCLRQRAKAYFGGRRVTRRVICSVVRPPRLPSHFRKSKRLEDRGEIESVEQILGGSDWKRHRSKAILLYVGREDTGRY